MKRFPHTDETGAAAGRIKNHVGQLPSELLSQLVTERLFSFDAIGFFERGHFEPAFAFFAAPDLGAAIGDETVDKCDVRAEFATFDDVRARSVARHENVCFETGARGISGERASRIPGAWNSELARAEIFCHRDGDGHAARFETLRRVQ